MKMMFGGGSAARPTPAPAQIAMPATPGQQRERSQRMRFLCDVTNANYDNTNDPPACESLSNSKPEISDLKREIQLPQGVHGAAARRLPFTFFVTPRVCVKSLCRKIGSASSIICNTG